LPTPGLPGEIIFAPDAILVDDRSHNDYRLFAKWIDSGVFFAAHMKNNTQFEVAEELTIEPEYSQGSDHLSD
jgi:hypothetical protein